MVPRPGSPILPGQAQAAHASCLWLARAPDALVWPGQVLPCWSAGSPLWVTVTSQESRCLGPAPEGLGCGLDMALLNLLKELSRVAQTETQAGLLLVGASHVPYRR